MISQSSVPIALSVALDTPDRIHWPCATPSALLWGRATTVLLRGFPCHAQPRARPLPRAPISCQAVRGVRPPNLNEGFRGGALLREFSLLMRHLNLNGQLWTHRAQSESPRQSVCTGILPGRTIKTALQTKSKWARGKKCIFIYWCHV